ncbi:MAG: hypothetical protein COA49_02655 [Bacteroidetes bacterium]|nr:MAG: hypothetical protein COA49_02655 [Bacteroidota bacterium]
MKNIITVTIGLASTISIQSQTLYSSAELDINNVKAQIYSCGMFFSESSADSTGYFLIDNENEISPIYQSAIWIGGLDSEGNLHFAAETFRNPEESPPERVDYWHGPVADSYNEDFDLRYNKVWKVNKSTINTHINSYSSADYEVPLEIEDWPAHGIVSNGEAENLAAFVDTNLNGVYDPENGDYPDIKGDQALFIIMNDDRDVHTASGGEKLVIEIHAMLYAYNCPDNSIATLNETTFLDLKIINRSENEYSELYVANWTDFDIGTAMDDNIGSDSTLSLVYAFNGDDIDGDSLYLQSIYTYGENPPALGVKLLNANFSTVISYLNSSNATTGVPTQTQQYYNYLQGKWKDGSPLTYGGNGVGGEEEVSFIYSSSPTNVDGWSMNQAGVLSHDIRGVGSVGPFTFSPGETIGLEYAIIFSRDLNLDNFENADLLLENSLTVQNFYDGLISCSTIGVESIQEVELSASPNPVKNTLMLSCEISIANIIIYDINGRVVRNSYDLNSNNVNLDISSLENGAYILDITLINGDKTSKKIVKN